MKLAQLAFEIVKDSIEIPSEINLDGFIRGSYDKDRDFDTQISAVFNYINLAFSRLVSDRKTLLKVTTANPDSSGYIEFTLGTITAIVNKLAPNYIRIHNTPFSKGVAVEPAFIIPYTIDGVVQTKDGKTIYSPLFVEYRPKVPHFSLDDIRQQTLDDNNEEEITAVSIDLEEYGITDEMCDYVKEYAKGGIMEYMSPDLSTQHTQMAENYLSRLKTMYTNFPLSHLLTKDGGMF